MLIQKQRAIGVEYHSRHFAEHPRNIHGNNGTRQLELFIIGELRALIMVGSDRMIAACVFICCSMISTFATTPRSDIVGGAFGVLTSINAVAR